MFRTYLVVMAGGAFGTALRLCLSTFLAERYGETFPVGTMVVNITGCFVIGLFSGLTTADGMFFVSPLTRQFVMIGILGGYTTFSSFSLQTLNLLNDGQWFRAGLNILFSVLFSLIAVWLGQVLAAVINHR